MTLDDLRARTQPGRGDHRTFTGEHAQMAPTLEACEFLYALVRLTRPEWVLEYGTGLGTTASFIGQALTDNDRGGWMISLEPNHYYAAQARELLADLDVVDVVERDDMIGAYPTFDLVFIDSDHTRRQRDIVRWLAEGQTALVVVHDANRGYVELGLGAGVLLDCPDGLWVGRAK